MNFYNRGITLCSPTFLMATSFGNAIVGLLLGFVQILPEQRRDQWAALLHRPVSRAVIFRGKAVAGLLLYAIATVPPFLLCFWLAATPGHFVAPFRAGTDSRGHLRYLRGGSLLFRRAGGRTATRLLVWRADVCPAGCRLRLLLHIRRALLLRRRGGGRHHGLHPVYRRVGAMLSNGKFRDRPRLAQWGLLAAVFYGVCGVGILASILVAAMQQQEPYVGSQYRITLEGQPIIVAATRI